MAGKKRLLSYDVIRAVAIVMVVAVHCLPAEWAPLLGHTSSKSYVRMLKALFFTCNALFFMLSGKFNLRVVEDEGLGTYYYRKVRGVLVPTLLFLLVYTVRDQIFAFSGPLGFCKTYVLNALGQLSHGIFWFVFLLFGMLVAAPFMAGGVLGLGPKGRTAFLAIGLGWATLSYVSGNLGIDFNWSYPLSGSLFFFCLGAFVEQTALARLSTRRLALLGLGCWFVNGVLAYKEWLTAAYDGSPLYAMTAICLYLLLLRVPWRSLGPARRWVAFVARHSFGIYLMHWLVYETISAYFEPLAQVWGPLYHVCLTPCVFILGLALAVLCDVALVRPVQSFMDRKVAPHVA